MRITYSTVPMTLSATVTTQRMLESSVVQSVAVELLDWQSETSMNSTKVWRMWTKVTTARMNWLEVE